MQHRDGPSEQFWPALTNLIVDTGDGHVLVGAEPDSAGGDDNREELAPKRQQKENAKQSGRLMAWWERRDMTNSKLQAALDELERLRDTVKGFKDRNGTLPNPDSDAGRALFAITSFTSELDKLSIGKLIKA
jgi:hypothetical protein